MRNKLIMLFNIVFMPFAFYWSKAVFQREYEEWIGAFLALICCSFVVQMVSLLLTRSRKVVISMFFLTTAYLFHFSHVFLIYIDYDFGDTRKYVPFVRHGVENTMYSMGVAWLFIYGVYWGILVASMTKRRIRPARWKFDFEELGQASFGIFLVAVSMPFFAYRTILFIKNVMERGYAFAANLEYSIYVTMLCNLMLPGFILWMTAKSVDKNKATLILGAGIFIRLVAMLTGQRAYNLMFMIALVAVYVFVYFRKKIRKRHFLLVLVAGYIMCVILAAIRTVRSNGMSAELILSALFQFEDNPVLNMMNEFAITGNIVSYTYKMSEVPLYGKQILSAFASIVPGISYILPDVEWSQLNVTEALEAWNWGGSFVADFYFDLHYAGVILCFVWGIVFQKFSGRFIRELMEENMFAVACIAPILCEMFFCVRSTTYKLPRMALLYFIFYIGLATLFAFAKQLMLPKERKELSWKG